MKCHFSQFVAAALMAASGLFQAVLAQPTLSHLTPGAVAPGKTTEIVLHGTKLDGPLRVWTSFPAQVEVGTEDSKSSERTQVPCKITLGAGVAVGIGGIVVAMPSGVSDVLYVMIDDLPSVAANSANHIPAAPQDISLPVAVDGPCEGTLSDYFRFAAKAGKRISCEVVAMRLGWDLDPLVRVLDARGNEILLADDDPASGADPRFVFTAPRDGQYVIELRDNRFKSGGRYRLRLGDFPLVTTPLPLVVHRGTATALGFTGPRVLEVAPLTVLVPALALDRQEIGLGVPAMGRLQSGWTTLQTTDLPVAVESDSAGSMDVATAMNLPSVATGLLEKSGDLDLFEFQGKKGTRTSFRAVTRSAGSAAVLSLRLQSADGKQIAESQVTDSDEPVLNLTLPADGSYKLAVEELAGRGGGDYGYAVECRTGPQFSLALKNDKNNRLRQSLPVDGGAFYLDVQCQRAGYDGPITLAIDSPRQGWQVFSNVVPAKANEVRMYVLAPLDFVPGEVAELRVVGRAENEGRAITASMTTTVQLRAARPQTPYPPAWHEGAIFVGGSAPKPSFFRVTASQVEVNFPRQAAQAEMTLDFERVDAKFKEAPIILPLGLPAGMTAEVKRDGASGQREKYRVTLKGAKDLAEGQHTLRFFTYAELGGQGRGVFSGDVRLNVVTAGKAAELAEASKP